VDLSDNLATRMTDGLVGKTLSLSRVSRRSAADEVRSQLVAIIESGQLQVDDRLPSEAELARRFGVSRPIIREALGTLQALGLTTSYSGRGTFVTANLPRAILSFGQYSSSDLNEVRRCLEVPAARMAAERRRPDDVTAIATILDGHDGADGAEEAVRFDGLFHCAIARTTGNMLFARLIEDLRDILQEQSLAISTIRDSGARAAREHRRVLDAIAEGDSDAAGAAMEAHLDAVQVAIEQLTRRGRTGGSPSAVRPLADNDSQGQREIQEESPNDHLG
jgi:GntR family transcriptional regulator, transcriptional repressor for pyruvate dehydrogenase complex